MVRKSSVHALALAAAGTALFAQPASASIGMIAMPMAVTSALAGLDGCQVRPAAAVGITTPNLSAGPSSKAAALLGGQVSQLDLIRQQQAGMAPAGATQVAGIASNVVIEPGAGGSIAASVRGQACEAGFGLAVRTQAAPPQYGTRVFNPASTSPDDILASKRLSVRRTSFDGEWNRVRSSGLGRGVTAGLRRKTGAMDMAGLGQINSWANSTIRYVEDRELYGKADHWASASETVRRGAGDCEDIAIVKMQALAALGIKREDMHLVIARDLARASDHAMLVVKLDGQSWLLDNATDQLLDARQSYDYRPILSFSQNRKWIHGY
jgi:predicted transglutaminase-like cysteine proteinase